jgi:antitoxin component YwqK of YwqJK toxin-antitoxin module
MVILIYGQRWVTRTYVNGKRDGDYKKWYYNGQPSMKYTFVNGQCKGDYKQWNENGQLLEHGIYVDGIIVKQFDVK